MTKEKFLKYEAIRESGLVNMYSIKEIILLANEFAPYNVLLSFSDVVDIHYNYIEYNEKYKRIN